MHFFLARGLGSLYAQANIMSMEDAGEIHSRDPSHNLAHKPLRY